MCGAQSGTGESSWLFTVIFYSWLCFTGQTAERNNADSLINTFTIQAATLKGVEVFVCVKESEQTDFTAMSLTTRFFAVTGQEQTGEGPESENIRSAVCTYTPVSILLFSIFCPNLSC